jgi:multiple sugar transport system permease protein
MLGRALRNVFVIVMAVVWLIPTYLLVVNACVPVLEYSGAPQWAPSGFGLFGNIAKALGSANLGQGMLNSLVYSSVSAALAVFTAALAGFALVIMRPKRPALWFWLIYMGTLLPLQIFLLPLFGAYVRLRVYDTQLGMVLVYGAICVPFAFFIVRNFLTVVPREIAEAAKLDGASYPGMFFRIHLPLVKSALFAAFIFQFTWVWNDLLFGIVLTTSPNRRPVMAALAEINGGFVNLGPPVVLAAALVVSLPTVVLFLSCQRFFASSLRPVG